MANLLSKAIKLNRTRHKIQGKLLYPKNAVLYVLRQDNRTENYIGLGKFIHFGWENDDFRNLVRFELAQEATDTFLGSDGSTRTMSQIMAIATHLVKVDDSEVVVYQRKQSDESRPFHLDFVYKMYGQALQDQDVDLGQPIVSIDNLDNGDIVSDVSDIEVTATDYYGISTVEFVIDGDIADTQTRAPFVYSWDSTQSANGSVEVKARATDRFGNQKTETIIVTVDN
jgi:hypothetical protein